MQNYNNLGWKHIYTVWIVPYPLYSALRAIHCTENTNSGNKWAISTMASASIYSVGGGTLRILESIWLVRKFDEKLKCSVISLKSLIHTGGSDRLQVLNAYIL